jgi:hypothetical protein
MKPERAFWRQSEWIAAVLVTAAAVALHLHFWLHIGGLWRDEVNQVNVSAKHSLVEMEKDSFPILMPLVVHTWLAVGLGNSDQNLRLIGLLVGLGILAALWISAWKARRSSPLLGLALFGLNSSLIFFGDSLRAYGLGSLLAAALTATAFVFLQQPSTARAAWLALTAILSVQLLYNNAVLVAAICFGAWAVCWRRKDGRAALQILLVAILSAASLLPYTQNLIAGAGAASVLRTGVKLPRFFASYNDTLGFPLSEYIYVWALLYAAIVFRACAGFCQSAKIPAPTDARDSNGDLSLFAAVALTLAVVGFPIFFWRAQLPMQSWYVLPLLATAAVCFDVALAVRHWIWRVGLLIFVAVTAGYSFPETNKLLDGHFSDVNLYAQKLTANADPKDYIVVDPWLFGITFDHYFKGATPWDTLPPLPDHATHRFDLVKLELQDTNAIAPVLQKIAQTLQSGHHVWILADKGWFGIPGPGQSPPPSLPPAPSPKTGWADWPYTQVWAAQMACFISDHSTQFGKLQDLSTDRFITEDVDAFVASGWKTNSVVP